MNNSKEKSKFLEDRESRLEALLLLMVGFSMVFSFVLGYLTARIVSIFNMLGG